LLTPLEAAGLNHSESAPGKRFFSKLLEQIALDWNCLQFQERVSQAFLTIPPQAITL
jgi:hypothetical protein